MKKLIEFTVITNTLGSELIAFIFEERGLDVAIYDKNDFQSLLKDKEHSVIWDYYDESLKNQSDDVILKAYIEDEKLNLVNEIKEAIDKIKDDATVNFGKLDYTVEEIESVDWQKEWKKYYKEIEAGDFLIVPMWDKGKIKSNDLNIYINPGMAFGTGDHETTRLCLKLMSALNLNDKIVIDVGAGSGILGIGAIKKNAKKVDFIDIDKQAIKNIKENIAGNGINKDKFSLYVGASILDIGDTYDIVIANITADILIEYANEFKTKMKDDGVLILSGIILKRRNDVVKAYGDLGFILQEEIVDKEWIALKFSK